MTNQIICQNINNESKNQHLAPKDPEPAGSFELKFSIILIYLPVSDKGIHYIAWSTCDLLFIFQDSRNILLLI